jgi:pimeloyl-ACP methyl ester carboxylesterase
MRRLVIGDRKLRVRDEGEGKRHPVVLIHGAGGSSVVWMNVVKRLAPRRRALALDLPGHGQSDPWHAGSIDLYRDAVGTVCAELGVTKAILVGHSMGGAIALRCALAWPERVAALVLVCSGARMKVAPAVVAALADPKNEVGQWMAQVAFSPSTPRDLVDQWTAVSFESGRETMLADLRACDGWDLRPDLPKIKTPTLAIGAADDLLLPPKLTLEAARELPNARALVLPHAGHMAHLEQPDAFHAALDPFLAEVG